MKKSEILKIAQANTKPLSKSEVIELLFGKEEANDR